VSSWHTKTAEEAVRELRTDEASGLSSEEAARRLAEHGPNALVERGGRPAWRILWEQLTSVLVVLLIVAAAVSVFLGDVTDAAAILAIVVLNTLLGFRQEYRAEKSMAALRRMAAPSSRVKRDGLIREVPSRLLVPGDVILFAGGDLVPADCCILESWNLLVRESALTGESEPVEKTREALSEEELPPGDRRNMAYLGSSVAYGRGSAVVVATERTPGRVRSRASRASTARTTSARSG
jgi:Ca2+-transporting ATPase